MGHVRWPPGPCQGARSVAPSARVSVDRQAIFDRLGERPFDVAVVGGGIVGAAIGRDAALRGLSVALVERKDFGAGTSSRTSRMLHGGVRYLRQGRLGLVRQALRERNLLRDAEPGLVQPTDFAVPVYEGSGLGPALTRLGLRIYRGFARDDGGQWLPPKRADEAAPGLAREGLRGIGGYRDVLVRDARLVLETIRSAARAGAVVANHAAVDAFGHESGRLRSARVVDEWTGRAATVRAETFVNASGPWVDAIRKLDDPTAEPILRPTKGVHLLVRRERIEHERAVVLEMRDGRIVFVLPWGDLTIVGTTDTDYAGSLDEVCATPQDVTYLLDAVNAFFPRAALRHEDVLSTYAGVRPLVWHGETRGSASDVSRSHEIVVGTTGLVTIAGGKLTTARAMAEDVVDRIAKTLGRAGRCRTRTEPLRHEPLPRADHEAKLVALGLSADSARHVAATYLSSEVLPILEDAALRERLVPGLVYVAGEVVQAARHEMACTLEDVLARRTSILLEAPKNGEECLERVAELLASVVPGTNVGVDEYREVVRRARVR